MKTIKNFLLGLTFTFISLTSFSQEMEIKGFVFHGNSIAFDTSGFEEVYAINQLFNFSLTDDILSHTIINSDGSFNDSQFYKIISYKIKVSDELVISITVQSGITKAYYIYTLHIAKDYEILNCEGEFLMGGESFGLKTYKQ